jgi:hypothetical protein
LVTTSRNSAQDWLRGHGEADIHGDDDQIVPIADSAEKTAKIVKGAHQLKVYPAHHTDSRRPTGSLAPPPDTP